MDIERLETTGPDHCRARWPAAVDRLTIARGELTVHATAADIVEVATFLRDDPRCQFVCIIDIYRGRLAERASSASTSSIICCRRG